MQRITDIWQDLVTRTRSDPNAAIREREQLERLERVSAAFQNLYWTRILSLEPAPGSLAASADRRRHRGLERARRGEPLGQLGPQGALRPQGLRQRQSCSDQGGIPARRGELAALGLPVHRPARKHSRKGQSRGRGFDRRGRRRCHS